MSFTTIPNVYFVRFVKFVQIKFDSSAIDFHRVSSLHDR